VPIRLAQTDTDILACFLVMVQLRTYLIEGKFLSRVCRQKQAGYRLVLLEDRNSVQAVAGFRFGESLSWGKYLYIDDLVTAETNRSHGYGRRLFQWLLDLATVNGCEQVALDSGVQRLVRTVFISGTKWNLLPTTLR